MSNDVRRGLGERNRILDEARRIEDPYLILGQRRRPRVEVLVASSTPPADPRAAD